MTNKLRATPAALAAVEAGQNRHPRAWSQCRTASLALAAPGAMPSATSFAKVLGKLLLSTMHSAPCCACCACCAHLHAGGLGLAPVHHRLDQARHLC